MGLGVENVIIADNLKGYVAWGCSQVRKMAVPMSCAFCSGGKGTEECACFAIQVPFNAMDRLHVLPVMSCFLKYAS